MILPYIVILLGSESMHVKIATFSLCYTVDHFINSFVSVLQMFGNWTFGTLVFTVMVITVTLKVHYSKY